MLSRPFTNLVSLMPSHASPQSCLLCGASDVHAVTADFLLFPAESYAPEFHCFGNWLCGACGVAFSYPRPSVDALVAYYNGAYRTLGQGMTLDGRTLEQPLQAEKIGISFRRFATFHEALRRAGATVPGASDLMVDFGAYQGMFLYAAQQMWGCRGIAVDYNRQGIEFARSFLGLTESRVTTDIVTETFAEPVQFATLVHSLEHFPEPREFLVHLRQQVLAVDGWLYIEVPNLFGSPLNDPTHFFSFSPDSLRWLVETAGFEVVELFTTGEPATTNFLARNGEENLVCLVRPAVGLRTPILPRPDMEVLTAALRRHWAAHARAAAARQARMAVRECLRSVYYCLFTLVLEPLAPRLALRLRRNRRAGGKIQ